VELSDLKSKVFTLLKEDEEFRYAVAGMLGFEEILRRLERHDKRFEEILHRLDRHEAELIKLREDMILGFKRHDEILEKHTQELIKLREDMISGFKRHDEILERHANEIAKLREDMISGFRRHDDVLEKHARELVKLREDMISEFKKHDEILEKHADEIAKLREDMILGFKRHANEITKLREDMILGFKRHDEILEKHAQELVKLREDFNVMLKVIGQIQEEQRRISEGQYRLEKRVDSLESAMISGFGEISKFAGLTFEEFVRKFLSASLKRAGEIPEGAELVKGFINGEEINIFLEDPLIVGEATSYAESANEIMKLLRKAEIAKAKYSKEPRKILVILTAKSDAAKEIIGIAKEKGVELVIGKIVD